MKHIIRRVASNALIIVCAVSALAQEPNTSPKSASINWDLVLKAIGIVIGAVGTFWQLRNVISKLRSTLKTDLEIFKMLQPADPNYDILKEHLTNSIRKIYLPEEGSRGFNVYSWPDFIFGVVFMLGFSIWTFYILKDGFNGWALLTAFFAIAGLGAFLKSMDEKYARRPLKK